MRVIDQYEVLLFDVQMTFMFDVDRFDATEDFHATYELFGGMSLDEETVQTAILRCFDYLWKRYESAEYYDRFPSLAFSFRKSCPDLALDAKEWALLEKTFAHHECGRIPTAYAECLKELSTTHTLGLISNIWAKKDIWLAEFEAKDILESFDVMVFSSDHTSIKPSPVLFELALEQLGADRSSVLFTGDSHTYDICGAKSVGIDAALTLNGKPSPENLDPEPDYLVANILDIPCL